MITKTATSPTINKCWLSAKLSYDETAITWQTAAASVHIEIWFNTTSYVTDYYNELRVYGAYNVTENPTMEIDYYNGSVKILDRWATVSLSYDKSTVFAIGIVEKNVEYVGQDIGISEIYVTLPVRPSPVSVPTFSTTNVTTGGSFTVTTNRQNSGYTHKLTYFDLNGAEQLVVNGITNSHTVGIGTADFANQMKNTDNANFVFRLTTYAADGSYIGYKDTAVKITLAASVVPTITSHRISDTNGTITSAFNVFLKGQSTILCLNTASSVYGATITKSEFLLDNKAYPDGSKAIPLTAGVVPVVSRVVDSRGRVRTLSENITVYDYAQPKVTTFSLQRCDSAGNLNAVGSFVKCTVNASVTSVKPGATELNTLTYKILYRVRGTTTWTQSTSTTVAAGTTSVDTTVVFGGGQILATNAYDIQLQVVDKLYTTLTQVSVPVAAVTLSLNKEGIGVGKVWQRGSVDCADRVYDKTGFITPVGAVIPYAGTTAPDGWLICLGQTLSRTLYADLFAVLGTTYGAGDGSTTFQLPNIGNRVPVGLGNDTNFSTIGKMGGEVWHQLTVDELPSHNHQESNELVNATGSPTPTKVAKGTDYGFAYGNKGLMTYSKGSNQAHNNLQPYIVLNYIIKY